MLTELTTVPQAALPIAALKEHLRLGSGFALAPNQDAILESYLRAAMSAIEGRITKALMTRRFAWSIEDWRDPCGDALPMAPVSLLHSLTLHGPGGATTVVPAGQYALVTDLHRPRIAATSATLPMVPTGGRAVVEFDAGFGAAWTAVPADLQQAVLLLAAEFYEHRHNDDAEHSGLPFAVSTLIERWRMIRILGGRGRK